MALCAAAGLYVPALGGDNTATVLTIAAWFIVAWALLRGARALKAPWWLSLPFGIVTSAFSTLVGLGLILYHPQTLLDSAWLTTVGNDLASGGLPLAAICVIGVTVFLAWVRGSWLGFFQTDFGATATSFQAGLLVVFSSFGLSALLERPLQFAVGLGLAFCFFGMLSLALGHHQQVGGQRSKEAVRSWLTIVLVGLVLALLVGGLVAIFING
jgi:hypothetical protein